MRQRFSILNVNATYVFQMNDGDASWNGPFAASSNNYDLLADWADVPRKRFNSGVNIRLPLGVFLTAGFTYNNGNPYSITTGKDDNGDGVINDRPPGVRRLTEMGPGSRYVNLSISKAVQIGKHPNGNSSNLNVFANLTNALNTTNLGTPSGVIGSPFFGKATYANNPREIEIGARFQF
jgi:hypothetical protein